MSPPDLTPDQIEALSALMASFFGTSWALWRVKLYRVVKVVDGDTVHLKRYPWEVWMDHEKKKTEVVRLFGIDTPERGQAGWQEAKDALTEATLDKLVRVSWHGRGKYGRSLAVLHRWGWNLNKWLLRKGLAREYV